MPIHDQGYRRYLGTRDAIGRSWQVMTRAGVMSVVSKRVFLGMMLFAWAPFVVRVVQFYFATTLAQASFLAPSGETFREFLDQQGIWVFFVTIYVGAGLIANDRRANALQLYLSKPMTSAEYIAGKLAILFIFLVAVTFLPAILLLITQALLAGNLTFTRNNLYLVPAITLYSLAQVLVAATTMLALSSLSKSSRYVGILFAGVIFFTQAMYGVLYEVTRDSSWAWVSFSANMNQLNAFIFRMRPAYATPWPVSLLMLLAVIAVSGVILERRVRGVEVVA